MAEETPNTVHGRLLEAIHISGYSFERACSELDWLLENDRWKALGHADGSSFVESINGAFSGFRMAVEERKPLAKKLSRIASQRAVAKALGVDVATVNRDVANATKKVQSRQENKEAKASPVAFATKAPFQVPPETLAKAAKREVNARTRQELHAEDERRVGALVPIEGKFKTLVIDPPWDYESLSIAGRAKPGYATMTHDDLLAFDVSRWAEEACHLYLWTTNNFMTRAVELMTVWGFQHKTVLTWVKPRWGLGSYFRNSTEHVLFGVRGDLRTRSDSIATHFEAPVSKHSEKPDIFYEIVLRASYLPCGELFQRKTREGFVNLFTEADGA